MKGRPTAPRSGLDVLHARVAFRDRSVSDVLDLALRFLVVHGRVYGKVALGSIVPLALISLLAGWRLGWAMGWLVAIPLAIVAEIPFTVLASRLVFQDEVHARDVLKAALSDGPRVAFVRALGAALVAVGLTALFVPGMWLATIFLFLGEVMLLERASVTQAFSRAQRVASSAASEVLVATLVLALVPIGGVLLADIAGRAVLGELLQFRPPQPLWTEGGSALATLGLFAQVPYLATARFFLYLNVRTRAEGWDIQTRFAAIATRAEDGGTA
jgi:putative flippase GtrA